MSFRQMLNASRARAVAVGYEFIRSTGRVIKIALASSIMLNLLFAVELHRAREVPSGVTAAVTGKKVATLSVMTLDGHHGILDLSQPKRPTIVYYFRPDCHWCMRNLPNIVTLTQELRGSYNIIGLSPPEQSLPGYLSKHHLSFPVYTVAVSGPITALQLSGGTPQTLVINTKGVIVENWVGAYLNRNQTEIEKYFHIHLPGLLPDESANAPDSSVAGG